MKSNFDKVGDFHEKFGHPKKDKYEFPDEELLSLRGKLIGEEFNELAEAAAAKNGVEMVDALADLLYVTYGFFHAIGVNADEVFDEVHRSNMSKLGADGKPIYREDGKILKGPDYFPPDISRLLK